MTVNLLLENKIIFEKKTSFCQYKISLKTVLYVSVFANIELSPHFFNMMLPIFERTTQSEIK